MENATSISNLTDNSQTTTTQKNNSEEIDNIIWSRSEITFVW